MYLKAISLNSSRDGSKSEAVDRIDGVLILLGTPLGNLSDLSERAIRTLRDADAIAAEDTRRLRVLLSHLHITNKNIFAVDANKEELLSAKVAELVRSGNSVVYTTDAGMPGISDPGAKLVRTVSRAGLRVDAIPGPSAPILAASLSGLCETGFSFLGFLPVKSGARRKVLMSMEDGSLPVIAFESPNRIGSLLADAVEIYGEDHPVFVGRELTKIHQELFYGKVGDASVHFGSAGQRGEFVVVIGAAKHDEPSSGGLQILEKVIAALGQGTGSTRLLAEELAGVTGVGKNQVYNMLVAAQRKASESG